MSRCLCLCGFFLLNTPTLWSTNTIRLYPRNRGATHFTNEALTSGLSRVSDCAGWPKGLDERERHIGVWFHYEGHCGLFGVSDDAMWLEADELNEQLRINVNGWSWSGLRTVRTTEPAAMVTAYHRRWRITCRQSTKTKQKGSVNTQLSPINLLAYTMHIAPFTWKGAVTMLDWRPITGTPVFFKVLLCTFDHFEGILYSSNMCDD